MISSVSVVDYRWDKTLRRMVVVCLILEKMLELYFLFLCTYL